MLSAEEISLVDGICDDYASHMKTLNTMKDNLLNDIQENEGLSKLIHSVRARVKSPSHLRDKLIRKFSKAKANNVPFIVDRDNLFSEINDLVGVRIIHLHTEQFADIKVAISQVLDECNYNLVQGPIAKVWDDDYRSYFKAIDVETEDNDRMYTSVHYVIQANRKTKYTVELQVRTLAEELWGEVDHSINYPHASSDDGCRDQIKVLARVTLGCSRLVDSIFATHKRSLNAVAPE